MAKFIESVVTDLLEKQTNFLNTTLILPGKRPMLFFREEFQRQAKNIILPQMKSIEELMSDLSGLEIISGINLWFKAYQAYKKVVTKPDTFEEFIKWGPTVLKDFDDIDASLEPANKILDYLVSVERINQWGEGKIEIGKNEVIQNHLTFWGIVSKLYFQLQQDLIDAKEGYAGMVFRIASEKVNEIVEDRSQHYIFAGFNALTKAEQALIFRLEKENIATLYWDVDRYYYTNPNQEAGSFLRKYKEKIKPINWIVDEFSKPKNLNTIGVAKQVGQAKYIADLIKNLSEEEIKNTALILADEAILPAILNSLPDNISHLNISMGIPLRSVPLAQFFKSIFELQMNREKLGKGSLFYFKNVLQILENKTLSHYSSDESRKLIHDIRTQNRIFNSPNSIQSALGESIFKSLFQIPTNITSFIHHLKDWTDQLLHHPAMNDLLTKEYLFYFKKVFNQLHENLLQVDDIKDYRTLFLLYNKIVQSESVAFIGEPLKGLQLMGLLETRLLNFDTIIMTSVNDQILPLGRQNNTFIPYDIRKQMKLNTFTENDSIYAYHFYRLVQRAKNAYFVYDTEADGMGTGEKSRFLAQIKFESQHKLNESFAAPNFISKPLKEIIVPKTDETMKKLWSWADYGISPSSLSTYLRNPLDFYEQRVFNVKDVEEAEETVSARTLGNIVHGALEDLYLPYLSKILTENDFKIIEKSKNNALQEHFRKEYKDGHLDKGPNYLIYKIAERIVDGVLTKDAKTAKENEFIIRALESKHEVDFPLTNGKTVKLRGIIDRIDSVNNQLRIIDYKTGFAKDISVKTEEIEVVYQKEDKAKQLQLIFYAHLFYGDIKYQNQPIELCIYPIKFPNKELIKLSVDKNTTIDYSIVENSTIPMALLIEEILNQEIPFKQLD
ncbi:PD-(D/E)XK nuclease superfamily protein [Algoriella xinjiangensis]|uniref:PD-(D/E)XK nuclease superfamily protein n=1 Tax=Algoriella xinjiangensis TaxID=684065 RepID=A0A1I4ZU83_9FLAO|nr:PD-(D/E)XK nuclease family protein [Algoriella xinjiangensis]SFN53804.1 PD-(D/E)XK nuclease superfamily protein [Algoriella xinjiangensis]VDH16349.1 Inactivated superfamily I helicase [Algoriella xinjiangensis]